ncbi:hypothetical protein BH20ACT17_BH20ACT17_00600 [soil metagenome]
MYCPPLACGEQLGALSPLTLAELNAQAALQDRIDTKYLVTARELAQLRHWLGPSHGVLEIGGRRASNIAPPTTTRMTC